VSTGGGVKRIGIKRGNLRRHKKTDSYTVRIVRNVWVERSGKIMVTYCVKSGLKRGGEE